MKYWFGSHDPGGWSASSADISLLFDRLQQVSDVPWGRPSWADAVSCGFCRERSQYFAILRDLCIFWSEREIRLHNLSDEARLIQLVLILRETDHMVSRVSEQITTWDRMIAYDAVPADTIEDPASSEITPEWKPPVGPVLLRKDLQRMKESRSRLSQDIAERCEVLMPNSSALVGPLVAARLLVAGGGLCRLSRMPGSAIQILGAEKAFFSHRISGSSPPKHGMIYEHKRVHAAPRKIRGRVARTLAASLAVAIRIDRYRGVADPAFLARAASRITRAGRRG